MSFRALILHKNGDEIEAKVDQVSKDDLPDGEVLIKVRYSSVNYKDGLASIPKSPIVNSYPFIPGIDLAGIVEESNSPVWTAGDEVIVTSYDLGVTHFGGYSEYARVPADWVVPLPKGMTLKESMAYGTAGFTAGLAVKRMVANGLNPEKGPVLVTGATGGVGSLAVALLTKLGYDVAASTGKESEHDYLKELGAKEILHRDEVTKQDKRPLQSGKWAGAVDPVGGKTLEYLLSSMKKDGTVALMGLAGGNVFSSTVYPFILRGVSLLGVDSGYCDRQLRTEIWNQLATEWSIKEELFGLTSEVSLEDLPEVFQDILKGKVKGRIVVRVS